MDTQCSVKSYNGNEKYIFISYSHRDDALVFPIIEQMAKDGYRVWYDEGIDPGTEWPEFIAEHLSACEVCIAFISSNSVESFNCKREINYAIKKNKIIVSVYLEKVKLTPGMEMNLEPLEAIHKYTYAQNSESKFYERLYSARGLEDCREVHPINNNDGTIATIPEEVPVHRERMPDIPQSKPQNKPQNKPVNNSVPASVSDRNEYATLESALKTASDKGIIRLQTEGGKQYIVLGSYDMEKWDSDESKGRGDGQKEDLLWEVIDYSPKTGNALVVCRNVVAFKPYNTEYISITWEQCSLRQWLNNEFFKKAFKPFEKELIVETKVSNPDNAEYGTKGGNDTRDKIFLLSLDEVNRYFASDDERVRRTYAGDSRWWWLRSPGLDSSRAAGVTYDGFVYGYVFDYGGDVYCSDGGVCPAFWINLNP